MRYFINANFNQFTQTFFPAVLRSMCLAPIEAPHLLSRQSAIQYIFHLYAKLHKYEDIIDPIRHYNF